VSVSDPFLCSRVKPTCNPNYDVKGIGRPYLNMTNNKQDN
jgi:hypothetical protein